MPTNDAGTAEMTPAVKTAGPKTQTPTLHCHPFLPHQSGKTPKPARVGGPLCVAAASSASWLAERERERVPARSLQGLLLLSPLLPPSCCHPFLSRLADHLFSNAFVSFHLPTTCVVQLNNTSVAVLCCVLSRASSSPLVNVSLILRLRWLPLSRGLLRLG